MNRHRQPRTPKIIYPRCRQHDKRLYPSEGEATRILVDLTRRDQVDPGMQIYPCGNEVGWHMGHAQGWQSFRRHLEAAR